jgi:histidine triad (HIT) family protein
MSGTADCLFCKIARREIPASVVREDGETVAFLDIYPHAPGHTLVVPRFHCATLRELPDEKVAPLFQAVKDVASLLVERMGAQGLTVGINEGKVAGQAVEHVHVHLMPRFEGDGGGSVHGVVDNPPKEPLKEIAEKLRNT